MPEGFATRLLPPEERRGDVEAFVLATWLNGYQATGRKISKLSRTAYYRTYHPALTALVRRSNLALCTAEDDPDVYGGFACGASGVLHYVFVRGGCRRLGLARELVSTACGGEPRIYTFTPRTSDLLELVAAKGMKYHPHPIPGVEAATQERA